MMYDDVNIALMNWFQVDESLEHFEQFLGMQFWRIVEEAGNDNTPEETLHKIELLLSPNHRTIIKAWLIQQEIYSPKFIYPKEEYEK